MSADEQVRVPLTYGEAVLMLPPGDQVHTWSQPLEGRPVEADWDRKRVLDALREGSPELAGRQAAAIEHGIVVYRGSPLPVFIQTRPGQP